MDLLFEQPHQEPQPPLRRRARGRPAVIAARRSVAHRATPLLRTPWRLRRPEATFNAAVHHGPDRWLDRSVAQGVNPNGKGRAGHRRNPALLRLLAQRGSTEVVHHRALRLLNLGADPLQTDHRGTPPLWWAAYHRRWTTVETLLRHGCSTMSASATPEHPWIIAVQAGEIEVVKAFLDRGWDVNHAPYRQITGLLRLAEPSRDNAARRTMMPEDKILLLDLLHEHGVTLNPEDPEHSPIQKVVRADTSTFEPEVFEWFVAHGVNLHRRAPHPLRRYHNPQRRGQPGSKAAHYDETGWTLLHLAARANNAWLCDRLLNLGLDPDACTSDGRNALAVARDHGHTETLVVMERALMRSAMELCCPPPPASPTAGPSGRPAVPRSRPRL